MIALVVSPVTAHSIAGLRWDWKKSQGDGERAEANQKFVHNKAPAFGCAEIAVRLSNESR
jgi:hypothetical protein